MSRPSRFDMSAGCLAADVVRAGLDPLTGRTLSFNHVPMAAWAGHLCDLLMAGAIVDDAGLAAAGPAAAPLHPLVEAAWRSVAPSLPRPWRLAFAPDVVDVNRSVTDTRRWLVAAGVWRRRRTLFGPRYTATGTSTPPAVPRPPGDPDLRRAALGKLVSIAQFGVADAEVAAGAAGPAVTLQLSTALATVVTTAQNLVAWKAGRPLVPGGGMR